jgi:C4-type Zn-finger protein
MNGKPDDDHPLLGNRFRRQAHVLAELRRLGDTLDRAHDLADTDDERNWLRSVSQMIDTIARRRRRVVTARATDPPESSGRCAALIREQQQRAR